MKKILITILFIILAVSCKNKGDVEFCKEVLAINGYSESEIDIYNNSAFEWYDSSYYGDSSRLKAFVPLRLKKIRKIPDSIINLDQLNTLHLSNLNYLEEFPKNLTKLNRLVKLHMPDNLKELPNDIGNLTNLKYLSMNGSTLDKFPDSFGNLGLRYIEMRDTMFREIPQEVCRLEKLEYLVIYPEDYEDKMHIPEEIGNMVNLEHLEVEGDINEIPKSIKNLKNLKKLIILSSKTSLTFPEEIYELENLEYLSITESGIRELPEGISKLKKLECLVLDMNLLTKLPDDLYTMDNWSQEKKEAQIENGGGPFGVQIDYNKIYNVTPEQDKWLRNATGEDWLKKQRKIKK